MVDSTDVKRNTDQKLALMGLLVLFVPIFSAEFFFALSRHGICGNGTVDSFHVATVLDDGSGGVLSDSLGGVVSAGAQVNLSSSWARELCSAHFD